MLYIAYVRSVPKVDLPLLSLDVLSCRRGLAESSTVPGLIASSLSRLACGDMPLTLTFNFVPPDPEPGAGAVMGVTPLAFVLIRLDIAVIAAMSFVSLLFFRFLLLASAEGVSSSLDSRLRLGIRDGAAVGTPLSTALVGGAEAGRSKGSAIGTLGPGGGGELPIVIESCDRA